MVNDFYEKVMEEIDANSNQIHFHNAKHVVEQKILNKFTFHAHLGVLHLMKKRWHCDKMPKEKVPPPFEFGRKERERTERNKYNLEQCLKYKIYMDVLYEYLFRVFQQGWSAVDVQPATVVAPPVTAAAAVQFRVANGHYGEGQPLPLIKAVDSLNLMCKFLFFPTSRNVEANDFERVFHSCSKPILENEKQMQMLYGGPMGQQQQQQDGPGAGNGMDRAMEEAARNAFGNAMERMSQIAAKIKEKDVKESHNYVIGSGIWVVWKSPFLPVDPTDRIFYN